jgi:hypothetical protein
MFGPMDIRLPKPIVIFVHYPLTPGVTECHKN